MINLSFQRLAFLGFALAFSCLSLLPALRAQDKEEKGRPQEPKADRPERPPHPEDPFRNLSSEDRDRLREAIRRAWNDPAVIEARDELRHAAETYQDAIHASIKRANPDLAEAIEHLRQNSESELKIYGSHGPGGKRGPGGSGGGAPSGRNWKDFEGFLIMENPSFLRELSPEKQQIYREAHRQAMNSPQVQTKLETFQSLRKEDEEMRTKRITVIRGVHQAIRQAMEEADPRVKEIIPENRRPGPGGEKGRPPGGERPGTPSKGKPPGPPKETPPPRGPGAPPEI